MTIRLGTVDCLPADPNRQGSCLKATPEEVCLAWEGVGTFSMRSGREVVIAPAPSVEDRVLRLFILGPALATILHQRGLLVLHASAAAVRGRGVVFLGWHGWGKSTIAATLHARGHGVVADDVVAVSFDNTGQATILSGFPQLKLWPDVVASLGDLPADLPLLHPLIDKRARRASERFMQGPLPLAHIFVLAERDSPVPDVVRLRPQDAFVELVRHSYVARLLERTGAASVHFLQCTRLVNYVPIARLERGRSLPNLPRLARLVEEEVARALSS